MVSGPCVPGGDGLLVTLGHGQLGGLFGGEQPDLLVLVAENRRAAGGQHGAAVGDDQHTPSGDGFVDPGATHDERARLDLPPGLFEDFPFESLLRAVVSAHPGCRVAGLQPPAGQLPLLALVLQQQHPAVGVDCDAFDGNRPSGRSIGHEGSSSVSGALGFLNVARAAYRLPWLSGSAESTICRFTSAVCRLTVDALPGRSPRCVQPSRWLPACWPRTTSTSPVPMLKLGLLYGSATPVCSSLTGSR